MNKARRKALSQIIDQIEALETALEEFTAEEQDALDNIPDSLAQSDRAISLQEAVDAMESAAVSLEEAREAIGTAVEA